MLTGIVNVDRPTSIYRWWINAESSQTVCNEKTWKDSAEMIQSKNTKRCYILTPEDISEYIRFRKESGSTVASEINQNSVPNLNQFGHFALIHELYVRTFGTNGRTYRFLKKLSPHIRSGFRRPGEK